MGAPHFPRILFVLFGLAWSGSMLFPQVRTEQRRTEVARGVSVVVPDGWIVVQPRSSNGLELVRRAAGNDPVPSAHMLIVIEPRRSHAEALDRLVSIANQFRAAPATQTETMPLRFFTLNGFAAIEERHQIEIPRPGAPQQVKPENEPFNPARRNSMRMEVAAAVNDLIVRFQGDIPLPGPTPSPIAELQAIETSMAAVPAGNAAQAAREIGDLQKKTNPPSPPPGAAGAAPAAMAAPGAGIVSVSPAAVGPGAPGGAIQADRGELEIASNDGTNVVIASNFRLSFSANRGTTFNASVLNIGFPNDGDPSVAVGASTDFYLDLITFPANGCANSVSRSDDNGANFNFVAHAVACPPNGAPTCFPDQEHLAADRANSSGGLDQLYNVWRNFPMFGACNQNIPGFPVATIVCSQDGGFNWPLRAMVGFGDFARVAVGRDGFVYTAISNNGVIDVNKFSSCANGLVQQPGFPAAAAFFNDVTCPVPGLDRCNGQNDLSSPTIAVDDTNGAHIFVAHANNTALGVNENIILNDSNDGGVTWSPDLQLNTPTPARRFMPWVCATGGAAWVSWYDRRTVTAGNNSNTEFFLSSAATVGGALAAGLEADLSGGIPDPQCASPFACGTLNPINATSCVPAVGAPPAGPGCPKYGDYNGIGCAAGQVFSAWASATPPAGVAAPGPGINIYTDIRAATFTPRGTGTPSGVFTCNRVCPNLSQCYGIGIVNSEPRFCSPPNDATDTLLRVGAGAPMPPPNNTGATPVFRCVQSCPNLAFCYGKGQLSTSPQNCFPKGPLPRPANVAVDTNLRVAPGPAGAPLPVGTNHVFRCENICPSLTQCYGKGTFTINPEFCFPKGPLPRPPAVASDTGLLVP